MIYALPLLINSFMYEISVYKMIYRPYKINQKRCIRYFNVLKNYICVINLFLTRKNYITDSIAY